MKWEQEVSTKENLRLKFKDELKNIAELKGELPQSKQLKYSELLQVLFRFPQKFQLMLNGEILGLIQNSSSFQKLSKYLSAENYTK